MPPTSYTDDRFPGSSSSTRGRHVYTHAHLHTQDLSLKANSCFVLFLFPKKTRKAGSLQQSQHGFAWQQLPVETAGLCSLRLACESSGSLCVGDQACVWAPGRYLWRHRGQGHYSKVSLAGFPHWPGTSLSCVSRGRKGA